MLVQRRRRWTNIKPALIQGVVFAGIGVFSDTIYPQDLPRPSRRTSGVEELDTNYFHFMTKISAIV